MPGIQIIGNSGVIGEVDANRNYPCITGEKAYSVGGEYVAAGGVAAVVAAALATNTNLMAMRFAVASSRKAYVTRVRVMLGIATAGAAGGIATLLGLQRFTAQTPTGGTARTAAKKNATHPSNSDMTDIRDSNAALTGTAPTWGDLVGITTVPNGSTNVVPVEWIWEPDDEPLVLAAGDGLGLRTQNAGPATATWVYSYSAHWYEK
jgi:hypothetical protein